MTTDNYDASQSLTPYYPTRADMRPRARIWSIEKALHDLAALGVLAFFEGPPGSDPTQLPGYLSTSIWLKQSAGVQTSPGTAHYWDGTSPASDEDNWPEITPETVPLSASTAAAAVAQAQAAGTAAAASSTAASASAAAASASASAASSSAALAASATANAADIYASTTAGLAAVTEGQYFWVPSATANALTLYREVSGVAVEVTTVASPLASVAILAAAKARHETEVANRLRDAGINYEATRVSAANSGFRRAQINADGTITIPAADYYETQQYSAFSDAPISQLYNNTALTWSVYAVAVDAARAADLRVTAGWNNVNAIGSGTTMTRPGPGIVKLQFRNDNGSGTAHANFSMRIWNDGTTPLTIYPLEVYTVDSPYHPNIVRFDDATPVPSKPVRNFEPFWERWGQDRAERHLSERLVTIALDSVNGSSGNAGTRFAPKQLMSHLATLAEGDVVGLYRGSTWRERIPILNASPVRGVSIVDLADGAGWKNLPIVSALDTVANGSWTSNGDGTYTYTWTADSDVTDDGYQNVYVVEIDTTAEAATPIAAQQRMTNVASGALAIATAGTAYIESLGSYQWRATIHPTDGAAPGTRYRYEVVARYNCADWFNYSRDGAMAGIMMVGQSHGYGSLAGPQRFVGDRIIQLHASTHGAVVGGGTLQRYLAYGTGDGDNIALVFYSTNGAGLSWKLREAMFYRCRVSPFYSHTSGTNYDQGEVDRYVAVDGRHSDGALRGYGLSFANQGTVTVKNAYVKGYRTGFTASFYDKAEISNSIFREIGNILCPTTFRNNIVALESISDLGDVTGRGISCVAAAAGVVEKSIFYARTSRGQIDSVNLVTVYGSNSAFTARKNIYLIDAAGRDPTSRFCSYTHSAGPLFTSDLNIYILCGSAADRVSASGRSPTSNIDFATYVAETGQDAGSMFVDLRDDPRGGKAVFMDPDNGDFRWAQTEVARRIAAYCVENDIGPDYTISQWPNVPTVDEAANFIHAA